MRNPFDDDAVADSIAYHADLERWEHLDAYHAAERVGEALTCADGHHAYRSNGSGGGVCWRCGDSVDQGEL